MKKKRLLALILVFTLLLSLPAFATTARSSEQIHRRDVRVTVLSGQIAVKASVYGMGPMDKIGCQSIYVYKQVGSFWVLSDRLTEADAGMTSTNVSGHMNTFYFDTTAGTEYKVIVTVFAENDAGRDSRTDIFYVTGK